MDLVKNNEGESPSTSRRLDADEIEALVESVTRSGTKAQLTLLAQKIRREASALSRLEASNEKCEPEEKKDSPVQCSPKPDAPDNDIVPTSAPKTVKPAKYSSSSTTFSPIDKFAFDAGGYDSQFVTLYIPLVGIGSLKKSDKEAVTCKFTKLSFDFVTLGLDGKSYRLFKENLEKDINPEKCKMIVKADKAIIKLAKVKGEYSYDHWTQLTAKTTKKKSEGKKSDPQDSIMDLMKNMYDEGDDKMKKVIGEAMLKSRDKKGPPGLDDPMKAMDDLEE